jgi:hypothetical protein
MMAGNKTDELIDYLIMFRGFIFQPDLAASMDE